MNTTALPRPPRDAAVGRQLADADRRPSAADGDAADPDVSRRARLAALHGATGVAPFAVAPGVEVVELAEGLALAGYARRGRWAITAGDVVAPAAASADALREYLHVLASRRLRPAFVAVAEPTLYRAAGLAIQPIADEAVVDLRSFSLAGAPRSGVRHAVASARRAGLAVVPYATWLDRGIAEVSQQWLSTKRGGEFGFTLSRHRDVPAQLATGTTELWAVVDGDGVVQAWCTWRHYRGGAARVLDIMRRRPDAPNPAMDFLIATVLESYRDAGVRVASLASVPRGHGGVAERVYPTRSLRAYKQKFAPRWEPRWLAVPAGWQEPFALAAVARAYCPEGMRRALRHN